MLRRILLTAVVAGGLVWIPQLAGATAPADLPGSALLSIGSRGPQVGILQSDLSLLYDSPGPIDGIFGPRTRGAVIEFQQYTGLNADGVVRASTWDEIHAYLNGDYNPTSGSLAATGADYGDVGAPILQLQQDLLAAGIDPGPVNAVYDAATRSALFAFEAARGLDRTTVVDSTLAETLGSGSSSPASNDQGSSASSSPTSSSPSSQGASAQGASAQGGSGSTIDGRTVLKVLNLTATAYAPSLQDNYPYGPVDYFGNPLVAGDVAVDPSVIPLNTWLWVTGYSTPFLPAGGFLAHAVDEGNAIKGMRIDLFINQSESNVSSFGIQPVKVYVLGN